MQHAHEGLKKDDKKAQTYTTRNSVTEQKQI